MSGPATKMHEALHWICCEQATWPDSLEDAKLHADATIEDITPEQLAVMDVAAEAMAWASERVRIEASITSLNPAAVVEVNSQLLWLVPENEKALLGELLRRAVAGRKEGGA